MPYGSHTADDRARMLETIGIASVDELFEAIPEALRAGPLRLDGPEPELELSARLAGLAARNRVDLASFLGAGAYRHWTPAVVDQMLLRGEWYTAYTPYQPEVSQGTLQSIYEYQSMLAELTGLDVVSASHYDGGAATAEAALMTCRATRRERILVSRAVHPHYRQTLETYASGAGLAAEEVPLVADGPLAGTTDLVALARLLDDPARPVAGVVAAQPNVLGLLEDMPEIGRLAHAAGALFVSVIEPVWVKLAPAPDWLMNRLPVVSVITPLLIVPLLLLTVMPLAYTSFAPRLAPGVAGGRISTGPLASMPRPHCAMSRWCAPQLVIWPPE